MTLTSEQRIFIKQNYCAMEPRELSQSLQITIEELDSALEDLYLKKPPDTWTTHEDRHLRSMFQEHSAKQVAQQLGRQERDVQDRADALGLIKYTKLWPKAKVDMILQYHDKIPVQELAALLSTTERSVNKKLASLIKKHK